MFTAPLSDTLLKISITGVARAAGHHRQVFQLDVVDVVQLAALEAGSGGGVGQRLQNKADTKCKQMIERTVIMV